MQILTWLYALRKNWWWWVCKKTCADSDSWLSPHVK